MTVGRDSEEPTLDFLGKKSRLDRVSPYLYPLTDRLPILQNHDNRWFPIWQHHTMKTKMTALFAALLLSAGFAFGATNDLPTLLQKGLLEEEANHNLEAAVRNYQAALDGFDQDRLLAATTVFRLGECLRKLGRANEAGLQYQRVLREFPDQTNLVKLCSDYLGGNAPVPASAAQNSATSAEDEGVRKIREMIRNSPDLINAPGNGAMTPLQSSVQSGNIAAAELLLANGANVNGIAQNTIGTGAETPLSMAADSGNKGMIELLLAKGADVNAPDNYGGRTPLYHACAKGFKTVAEVLIAHKADVNARRSDGWTPLHVAISLGFSAVAELLLANGANVNAADSNGGTPLFAAVQVQPAGIGATASVQQGGGQRYQFRRRDATARGG